MLPVEQPFKTYTDLDGHPLDNGYVYFGQPNQNPITAPVTVYWDAAGTQPAAQPLRTENGYVVRVRGGTPANVFFDAAYSELVQDKHGRQVFYARTSDDFSIATTVLSFIANLAASTGASLIGFLQSGAGAVARTLLDRGRDTVSAFDFMTPTQISNVRAGVVTDITTAVQAAIDSFSTFGGTVDLPPGNFRISAPLVTSIRGLHIRGASKYGTYITAADGSTFDMLRIAHQQCEVSGIIFRPASATQVPIRVYAGRAHIHDNYFLAAVDNSGIGILLTDTSPVDASFIAGAYVHVIENNIIGDSGFAFANGITESSSQGITATKFINNTILSDRPIQINKGGGNSYFGNLLQSSTGTSGTKAGVGITLGATVAGEKILGNYFELFLAMIETLNPDGTNQIFHAPGNHDDNCAATVADAGAKNYLIEDTANKLVSNNGWTTSYIGTLWSLITNTAKTAFAADTNGNCFLGASSGSSHVINRPGSTEADVILNFQGAGTSIGYMQDARGTGVNGANTFLALNKNSTTSRSINTAGTVNASGADYAEYMLKATGCGVIAKGQIIGIDADGNLTDKWTSALTFAAKSTNPSYVGGDTWAAHLGERPTDPDELAAFEIALEAARQNVDRIAFAGQVPVNVLGAQPGQYIVAVQDGDDIKGIARDEADMTLTDYMRAVGKVIAIEADGRARIIVKVS
jgi:hypothetical protein